MTEQSTVTTESVGHEGAPVIGVIVSTTRRNRVGRQIADQVAGLATGDDADVRLIDLAEVALPFLDEPDMPARGNYVEDTTKKWARVVASLDAVVIVTAEYNGGYPAPLKNALGTVWAAWNGKPVLVVSYGGRGGQRCTAALVPVFQTLRMDKIGPDVSITQSGDDYAPHGPLTDPGGVVEPHRSEIKAGFAALHAALRSGRD
ncbi:NADPH-dependent FMN reductase [Kocuria sp. KD4]|uniref:NADPH-dependent FMN reductase n=1 Tax=Kocuria sp. KD4 TaxID=2719588 RepID=UPI0014278181|nr:NAD(P)H-dependent oxidoreductase [Kocuria sp. KD4]QIR69657.1 NAD(P)H-dependent oxidoreductase [Kocuria sp. KD4]